MILLTPSITLWRALEANAAYRKIFRRPLFPQCEGLLLLRVSAMIIHEPLSSDAWRSKTLTVQLPVTIIHPVSLQRRYLLGLS